MRAKYVALFFVSISLAWGVSVHAAVVDSQLDDSAQAIRPAGISYLFLAAGYVPPRDISIYGVRFRVNTSGGGKFVCPTNGGVMRYYGTSTPPSAWGAGENVVGSLVNVGTTTPGLNGNCDYTTLDKYGRDKSISLSPNYYHVFFMNESAPVLRGEWVSMNGKPYASTTLLSLFGYRNAFSNSYEWGTTGLDAPYFEFFDTAPPSLSPTITILGATTTTTEFGSVFTDPGATAHDDSDGDITSSIQVSGTVNTSMMGTTTLTYSVSNSHGLSATTTRAVVVACTHDCSSSVLFLPGIEGSRLYEGANCDAAASEEKLWEPYDSLLSAVFGAGDEKVKKLLLNQTGDSVCDSVYAKANDIIDSVGGSNIYKSFIDEMDGLKTDKTIANWKPVAYDWRLSLDDLLNNGAERDGKIYYEDINGATSTPYIEQTLRSLAVGSKTGKVTIIAHSNGGLVAKALLNRLGSEASKSLVDKIIMVGVPQSGAPEVIGSTLVGYNAGIYKYFLTIISNAVMRSLAQNSPMAYHLLPSQNYFNSVASDTNHPVIRFDGNGYIKEISVYGPTIETLTELDDFLLAKDGGREKPTTSDTSSAEILNASFLDYANDIHTSLDAWTPPTGIEVNQIAGWGADTVAGIGFVTPVTGTDVVTALEQRKYRPIFTEDGDGTVPVPSALMMNTNTEGVKRYWVNLDSYFRATSIKRSHKDLFEIPSLEDFVKNIIVNSTSSLPAYISTTQPDPITESKKLSFFLHSPLTLQLTDGNGNITGLATDNSITEAIPSSTYGEFGDVKYIIVPEGNYQLIMHGQASGTFSLDIQESYGGVITTTSTIANVPTTANTLVTLSISGGIDTVSPLTVDENGDGKNITVVTPKVGETVSYEPPAIVPESRAGSGGAYSDMQAVTPTTVANSTNLPQIIEVTIATTTQPIETATTTIVVTVPSHQPSVVAQGTPKHPSPSVAVIKTTPNLSQTASVYNATSQQPFLTQLGKALYNSLYGLWSAVKRFF